jgi:hypothetical protein
MYQPYPTSPSPEPQQPGIGQPRSVRIAVRLMYVGAALDAVGVILGLATIGTLKSAIAKRFPSYTPTQIHGAEVIGIVSTVAIGLIAIGLWVWMAWANGRGKSWARVVAAVLFGINTVNLLLSLARVHVGGAAILGILVWLVGLGAIFLIFSKESAPFYQQQSRKV